MNDLAKGAIAPVGALACALLLAFVTVPIARSMPHPEVSPAGWAPRPQAAIKIEPIVTVKLDPARITVTAIEPEVVKPGLREPDSPFVVEPAKPVAVMAPVDDYLCEVYRRTPTKADGSGDFTWKDAAAAKRVKMDLCAYAVAGLNRDFREQLYHAGKEMDRRGIKWSMLSAFRDDYRQKIATGIKARTGYSQHGGSHVTGGHGDGRAIDIAAVGPVGPLLKFIDSVGAKFGLYRPFKGFDPQHVQPAGSWQKVAAKLRIERAGPEANKFAAAQDKSKGVKIAAYTVKKHKVAKRHKAKKTRYAKRHRVKHHRGHA